MSAIEAGARAPETPWRDEIRATLSLSWPMVLTNLAQIAMTATDVMMMGRAGPRHARRRRARRQPLFRAADFGLGLMNAASPMMAAELGRNRHAVREIRRTVRQGLWIAVLVCIPIWLILWNTEAILAGMGQDPVLAEQAGIYVRWLQWAVLPFYGYIILRSFMAALERPRWALLIVVIAVSFNAFANWCLIFGNLGFPAMGISGSGLATTLSSILMFVGLAIVVSIERGFRRYHLFGRFWRADWPRFRSLMRLGLPIAGILTFEVCDLQRRCVDHGNDRPELARRACHRNPDRLDQLHGAHGDQPGMHRARRPRLRRRRPDRHHPRRMDGVRARRLFHGADGATMVLWPRTLISGFIDIGKPEQCGSRRPGRHLPGVCRPVPDRRWRAGGGKRHAARPA